MNREWAFQPLREGSNSVFPSRFVHVKGRKEFVFPSCLTRVKQVIMYIGFYQGT